MRVSFDAPEREIRFDICFGGTNRLHQSIRQCVCDEIEPLSMPNASDVTAEIARFVRLTPGLVRAWLR
jgi:hypothetical protein